MGLEIFQAICNLNPLSFLVNDYNFVNYDLKSIFTTRFNFSQKLKTNQQVVFGFRLVGN